MVDYFGGEVAISGSRGESFRLAVGDSLVGLTYFEANVFGHIRDDMGTWIVE